MKLAILIILVLFCCGCERGNYFDTGAVLIDNNLIKNVEVKK